MIKTLSDVLPDNLASKTFNPLDYIKKIFLKKLSNIQKF